MQLPGEGDRGKRADDEDKQGRRDMLMSSTQARPKFQGWLQRVERQISSYDGPPVRKPLKP